MRHIGRSGRALYSMPAYNFVHMSDGDVAALTGAHTKRGQIKNLAQNGVRHTVNAAGWPVVKAKQR